MAKGKGSKKDNGFGDEYGLGYEDPQERNGKFHAVVERWTRPALVGEWDENALHVLHKGYLKQRPDGSMETPEDMCWRVVTDLAEYDLEMGAPEEVARARAEEMYTYLVRRDFSFNTPTMQNAGTGNGLNYAACYVRVPDDDMRSIFGVMAEAAIIQQSGGGTGFSFSRLRPKGDLVRTTGGSASGPVSFMRVYNRATEAVKQGGTRRGANMGILRVDHPDILEFIDAKNLEKNPGERLNNFNISVGATHEFMRAYREGRKYALVNPRTGEVVGELDAREVMRRIAENAHRYADPGMVFLDTMNDHNPTPHVGEFESTNPCGEQPLLDGECCTLGAINLAHFVERRGGGYEINWDRLREIVHLAVRFLDNVVGRNHYPFEIYRKMATGNRKIGLGIADFWGMATRLGIPYDSEEGEALAAKVMKFIYEEAVEASRDLARERGPFPNFPGSVYDQKGLPPMRNAAVTTVAPTGATGIIMGVSAGGVEPLFAVAYHRRTVDGAVLPFVNRLFEEIARERGFYSDELVERICESGSCQGVAGVPEDVQRLFRTANEIDWRWHIRIQAAFQKYVDAAVSKTINMPRTATVDDVEQAYVFAYESGCKGITVYVDGSHEWQPLNAGTQEKEKEKPAAAAAAVPAASWGHLRPVPLPEHLVADYLRVETPFGTLHLHIDRLGGHPVQVFATLGRGGSDMLAMLEATCRLLSNGLRAGIDPYVLAEQLVGIGGRTVMGVGPEQVLSVADALGKALIRYLDQLEHHNGDGETGVTGAEDTAAFADPVEPPEVPAANAGHAGAAPVFFVGENHNHDHRPRRSTAVDRALTKLAGALTCTRCGNNTLIPESGCWRCTSCGASTC